MVIQNANTQIESLKKQGIGATVLGVIGSADGTVINLGGWNSYRFKGWWFYRIYIGFYSIYI